MQTIPKSLQKQPIRIILIGVGCFFAGTTLSFVNHDSILFYLSLIILVASLFKGLSLLWTLSHHQYISLKGICIGVERNYWTGTEKISLAKENDTIQCLYIKGKLRLTLNHHYCFYYLPHPQTDKEIFQDGFLGYEEINEGQH